MAKVVGIAGSPRRDGNSATLMRAVLRGAAEAGADVDKVQLNGMTYRGCQGCARCRGGGACVLDDDLTRVMARLREAEGWVLASPIYYDGVTGLFKTFFDRVRTLTYDRDTGELAPQLEGPRRAVVIVTYEDHPRDDYAHEAQKLAHYLPWLGDFRAIDVVAEGDLGPADAASQRPDLLARCESLGREMV